MADIQIFNNPQFGEMRTWRDELGEPWFCGADVCMALGYAKAVNAIAQHVEKEDTLKQGTLTGRGKQSMTYVNESGLYSLIFGSRLAVAKDFKRWVTSEVLPAIRKHGVYMTNETLRRAITEPDFLIELATELKNERKLRLDAETTCKEQQEKICELDTQMDGMKKEMDTMKEKVSYLDIILATTNSVLVTQIAQDYGESPIKFNRRLSQMKIQYSRGGQWILYAPYKGNGYVTSETYLIRHNNGREEVRMGTKWTQKGRRFLYEKLKCVGVLPVIERNVLNFQ